MAVIRKHLHLRFFLAFGLTFTGLTTSLPSFLNPTKTKPHIILIVADDLGWNDVSWNNPQAKTPHLEGLAKGGVLLNQSYVQPICTPTRSALLTGRYPLALGRQHDVLWPEEPTGLSIKRQLLPQALKAVGYSTHAVGKWHLGFCSWDYTPTRRGFDSFWGYYTGAEDYYHHTRTTWNPNRKHGVHEDNYPQKIYYNDTSIRFGYDFRNNTIPEYSVDGTYSSYLFSSYVENMLETRNESDPLFLYMPFQSVHSPLQVPENYTQPFAHIKNQDRRTKLGMVLALDEAVGRVVEALKNSGHYNNSVIVFTTDNGGPTVSAGNNWPLRGNKTTLWEGGTRGVAFVHSPLLPQKGIVSNKLIHVTDWFSTLAGLGGGVAPADTDGYDQWEAITTNASSPRKEMVYNIDITNQTNAAVRIGYYKLIIGDPGPGEWTPPPEGIQDVKRYSNKDTDDESKGVVFLFKTSHDIRKDNNLKTTGRKKVLHSKSANSGPFIINADFDTEDENKELFILTNGIDNKEAERDEPDSYEYQELQSDEMFEDNKNGFSNDEFLSEDIYDFAGILKDLLNTNSLINKEKIDKYNIELTSLLSEDVLKTKSEQQKKFVRIVDLGLDLTKYKHLGQFLTNKTEVRLYNLEDDPEEQYDQAEANPDLVETLLGVLQRHMKDYVEADILPNDPHANPAFWNNTWTPGWCQAK